MLGYQNKVLRINLTNKTVSTEPLNQEWAEKYIGGKGLVIRYLYGELAPGIDPLGPDNKLILMTGPLTGTIVPCSGKLAIGAKSPATGTILDCSIGGHSSLKIKFSGYDAIITEGKLDKPGYIIVDGETIEFVDASDLWGKGSTETENILNERYGHKASYLTIGPAGENLLPSACINSDYYRQAGRGGIGSVMGSKNVKAFVLFGKGTLKVNDIENTTRRIAQILREDAVTDTNLWAFSDGTGGFVDACNEGGIMPKLNFSDTTDTSVDKYNTEALKANRKGKKGCGSCALGCGNFTKVGNSTCEGPEYESIAVAGPNCGIDDFEAIVKFNQVCDDMGLDTISVGDTIAWAMEMTEKGLHDFGIRFGDKEKYIEYLKMIAKKEGIGAELALGVKKLSEKYGGADFAMHIKGLEFPQYEPRGSWGTALAYAVSDRGACHMRSYPPAEEVFNASIPPFTAEGKGQLVHDLAVYNQVKFSTILCDFWALSHDTLAEVLTLVTGKTFTVPELEATSERIMHLARAFNNREGFDRSKDTIPGRLVKEALKTGPAAGQKIPPEAFEQMLDDYYSIMGWSKDGIVPEEILKNL